MLLVLGRHEIVRIVIDKVEFGGYKLEQRLKSVIVFLERLQELGR